MTRYHRLLGDVKYEICYLQLCVLRSLRGYETDKRYPVTSAHNKKRPDARDRLAEPDSL